jgi:hypothetical protein
MRGAAIHDHGDPSILLPSGGDLVRGELAVDAVRDHALAGLEPEPGAVESHLDLVRLEGDQAGDPPDPGPGVLVRPGRAARAADVVVAGQALVRAEGLASGRGERGQVDVVAGDVPAGGEPGLVQRQRAPGVGYDLVLVPNGQVPAGLPDIYAVVRVGGMADDSLVFLVKGLHRPPRERHPALQFAGVIRQPGVLPGGARLAVVAGLDGVPGSRSEVGVLGGMPAGLERAVGDGREREVGHRIAAGFVQQHDVLAVGDPVAAEPDPHTAAQRLGEQHPVGERPGDQEPADGSGCQRSLLPGQAHGCLLICRGIHPRTLGSGERFAAVDVQRLAGQEGAGQGE